MANRYPRIVARGQEVAPFTGPRRLLADRSGWVDPPGAGHRNRTWRWHVYLHVDIVPQPPSTAAERLYRALLRLYPPGFRRQAEPELLDWFRQARADRRTPARYWLILALDLIGGAAREWLALLAAAVRPRPSSRARFMETLLQDVRYALRGFARAPLLTLVTALTIAIGIAATSTIFSAANSTLLRAPPGVSDAGRLVTVHSVARDGSGFHAFSYLDFEDLRSALAGRLDLAAFSFFGAGIRTEQEPSLAAGEYVTDNYFRVVGGRAALGRLLAPGDDLGPGGPRVAVLSHSAWQRYFGAAPDILTRRVVINGEPFSVVGVTQPGFRGHIPVADVGVWVPLGMQPVLGEEGMLDNRQNVWLETVGRVAPGAERSAVEAALSAVYARTGREMGRDYDRRVDVQAYAGLPGQTVLAARAFFGLLLALAGFVLVIATANVANVLLARAGGRAREVAVRLSVGARRSRLMRQLLTESLVLFAIGGSAGVALAVWATRVLSGLRPPVDLPVVLDVTLDARVLAFSGLVTLATGILCGLAPALQSTRPDLARALKEVTGTAGGRQQRLRGAFVAAQVAGTVLLLVTAGLFARALGRAGSIDLGFDPGVVHAVTPQLEVRHYDPEQALRFMEELERRALAIPGVVVAGSMDMLPLMLSNQQSGFAVDGRPAEENVGLFGTDFTTVSPGLFQVLGLELVHGRLIGETDRAGTPQVAVVNETLAQRVWPGVDPIGRRIGWGRFSGGVPTEIVGVVRDAKYRSIGEDPVSMLYLATRQNPGRRASLVVRSAPGTASPAAALRDAIRAIDPEIPLAVNASMEQLIGVGLLPNRVALAAATGFGLTGLLLAAVGLYGVLAHLVTRRRREIGIRMALGAEPESIRRLVFLDGARLVAIGVALGSLAALPLGVLLRSLLYGLSPIDPATYGGMVLILAATAWAACAVPARRAVRTQPVEVLRHD